MPEAKTIAATTHGRYLIESPPGSATGLIVGFHGYGEGAEAQLDRLRSIPSSNAWLLVSHNSPSHHPYPLGHQTYAEKLCGQALKMDKRKPV